MPKASGWSIRREAGAESRISGRESLLRCLKTLLLSAIASSLRRETRLLWTGLTRWFFSDVDLPPCRVSSFKNGKSRYLSCTSPKKAPDLLHCSRRIMFLALEPVPKRKSNYNILVLANFSATASAKILVSFSNHCICDNSGKIKVVKFHALQKVKNEFQLCFRPAESNPSISEI